MNNTPASDNPLVDSVLRRIKTEKILPRSHTFFLVQRYGIWVLWLLTLVMGAVAVAIVLLALVYRYLDLHEVIRETFWLYTFEILPYLWLALVILMSTLAIYNLRHTSHGYRYSFVTLVASSLIGSLGGGIILYMFGFGFLVDSSLGIYIDSYDSQEKVERYLWQEPEDGRLIGEILPYSVNDTGQFSFVDSNNLLWQLKTQELSQEGLRLLDEGTPVRLLGLMTEMSPPTFLVCEVLPVRARHNHSIVELFNERNIWLDKLSSDQKLSLDDITGLCPKAVFMSRMESITH